MSLCLQFAQPARAQHAWAVQKAVHEQRYSGERRAGDRHHSAGTGQDASLPAKVDAAAGGRPAGVFAYALKIVIPQRGATRPDLTCFAPDPGLAIASARGWNVARVVSGGMACGSIATRNRLAASYNGYVQWPAQLNSFRSRLSRVGPLPSRIG